MRSGVLRATLSVLIAGVLLFSLSMGVAYATGLTWLNYVYTGANQTQSKAYGYLNQAAARPGTNRWGCANIYNSGNGGYLFANSYCGTIHYQGSTPYIGGYGAYGTPTAWNDWSRGQDLWGWEDH